MEGLELIAFQIISAVGSARSSYIEAIQKAKSGDFEGAKKLITEGEEMFVQGHHAHAQLIQQEAAGEKSEYSLLLMHAEDQLMSAESFRVVSEEIIALYEKIAA